MMSWSKNLIHTFIKNLTNKSFRTYSDVIKEQLKVQTFCDININLPYNVNIKPFDVHKQHSLDRVQFELMGVNVAHSRKSLKHIQDGNNIKIFAGNEEFNQNVTCHIYAPLKANLNITAKGNICAGFFNGSKLVLKSSKGNIYVDRYSGGHIDLWTDHGNIILKGSVVAATIKANVANQGSIKTKRLQGLNTHLKTNEGNITVDASYSDECLFETKCGNMDLQNIHKSNKILLEKGNLNINGLDGQLEAQIQNGNADIQLSRILNNSKISITENGDLLLRISEECQDCTKFEIVSKEHVLDPSIKSIPCKNNVNTLYLTPISESSDEHKLVQVVCEKSLVKIQSASWMSMLKLNIQK